MEPSLAIANRTSMPFAAANHVAVREGKGSISPNPSESGTFAWRCEHIIGSAAGRRGATQVRAMQDLVIRARGGDRDAFSRLAAGSIGRLTAVARMILRDEYAAQDAVQEAFIEAWRSLPGLREPDKFEAWSRRLLVRACFKRSRRSRRVEAVEIRMTPGDEPAISGGERALDLRDQLERGLARLPAEQRAVVVLVYYLDLPLADAAQALGIPLGTTKSRLNRATQALRAAIEADDRMPSGMGELLA
jgi:RNA polymerase sigma-70 factor (ECF subfamily)